MRSFIEVLESRIAPASVVNVAYAPATGKLDITPGDAVGVIATHEVHVFPTGANTFRVEAQGTTTIGQAGDFALDFTGKLSIVNYVGGDGDDSFSINNFKSIATLSFDGNDGVDSLSVTDVTTTGDVTVKFGAQTAGMNHSGAYFSGLATVIGGSVVVDYGSGGGFVDFNAIANTVKGAVTLTGGAGADELYVDSHTASFAKGIRFIGDAGDDYVSFDGGSSVTVGKGTDGKALFFDGGDDADELSLYSAGSLTFQGAVQFDGGAGGTIGNKTIVRTDALTIQGDFLINGGDDLDNVDVGSLTLKVSGDWKMNLGSGANSADIYALTMTVSKTLGYQGGAGIDNFKLDGTNLTISNRLEVSLGDAVDLLDPTLSNTVDISPRSLKVTSTVPLLPALAITGGADGDEFDVSPHLLTVTGLTLIDGGNGVNTLELTPENGTFTKDVVVTGGTGDDTLEFGRDFATLKAGLTFNLGAGTNDLEIQPDVMTVTKDLKITGAGSLLDPLDVDTVHLDAGILKVMGATEINLGDGANTVDGYMTSATFSKTFNYVGGAGDDVINLSGTALAVKGAVSLAVSAGKNQIDLHEASITLSDSFTVQGGDLLDVTRNVLVQAINTIGLGNRVLRVTKATTFALGTGQNLVGIQAGQTSFGALTVTSADTDPTYKQAGSADLVLINATKFSASGLVKFDLGAGKDSVGLNSTALALKAGLNIHTGADADGVSIFADGTITGDVTIDTGAASDDDQGIYLSGNSGFPGILKVTGALTLLSAADGATGKTESINVFDVTVTKAISVTAGAAMSAINLNNASTSSSLSVSSGAGEDTVQIETFSTFGSMTVAKATSILLGDDKDALTIGFGDSNNIVRFLGAVTIDGGAGTDAVNDLTVNFFAPGLPAPILTSVP